MDYQITLLSTTGQYKPVSCIIRTEGALDLSNKEVKTDLIKRGTVKIAQRRYWSNADLKKYGYTRAKVREYDKDKIKAEAEARYEAIKEQKYESGEWRRPNAVTK